MTQVTSPPVPMDERNVTIGSVLQYWATQRPDRDFVVCGPDRLTYSEMMKRAEAVAAGLSALGLSKGDRLATVSANRSESIELYFACSLLGIVQVPLNIYLKGDFLRYQLNDAAATAVAVDVEGLAAVQSVLGELDELKHIIAFDDLSSQADRVGTLVPYTTLRATTSKPELPQITANDVMSIVYTSGTTGMPKGCVLTHGYYLHVGEKTARMGELRDDDIMISALPLFHGGGRMMVIAAMLRLGATAVVESSFSSNFLQRAIDTGATVICGVVAMGRIMVAQPPSDADRAHRVRIAIWGPTDLELEAEVLRRFGFPVSSQTFGQTECALAAYAVPSDPSTPGSSGRATAELEMKIVDDNDEEVATGEPGEILFRPAFANAMFRGYWRRPEDSLHTFRGLWYHTGDYGRVEADGALFFVDRKKDYLRRRGENISSIQVEVAIRTHPAVADVAVHGVPSAMGEDDVKACVVLADGASVEPKELFAFFVEKLPYFAVPRYVEVLPELPKNALLRVMKHVLRDRGITETTWDFDELGLTVSKSERR